MSPGVKIVFSVLLVLVAFAYVFARLLDRESLGWLTEALTWVGSFWIVLLCYFFLSLLFIDILRLANYAYPFFPLGITRDPVRARLIAGYVVLAVVSLVVIAGHINSRYVRVKSLSFTIDKNNAQYSSLKVVAASDFHLGTVIGPRRTQQFVDKINAQDPDIVLIAGDVVDGAMEPVIRQDLGTIIAGIRAKYGVYAVTGNHEYFGAVDSATDYLTRHGVKVLRDTVVEIAGVYIIGREDRSFERAYGRPRKTLPELLSGLDATKPLLMMDHQPYNLEDADTNGIDFQLSGHSHHGQFWPINHITNRVYEVSWGYKKKQNTHVYVSCGAGTWGPPVRIGSTPEIMTLDMRFRSKKLEIKN